MDTFSFDLGDGSGRVWIVGDQIIAITEAPPLRGNPSCNVFLAGKEGPFRVMAAAEVLAQDISKHSAQKN
jgi:hypothetical protein